MLCPVVLTWSTMAEVLSFLARCLKCSVFPSGSRRSVLLLVVSYFWSRCFLSSRPKPWSGFQVLAAWFLEAWELCCFWYRFCMEKLMLGFDGLVVSSQVLFLLRASVTDPVQGGLEYIFITALITEKREKERKKRHYGFVKIYSLS